MDRDRNDEKNAFRLVFLSSDVLLRNNYTVRSVPSFAAGLVGRRKWDDSSDGILTAPYSVNILLWHSTNTARTHEHKVGSSSW